MDWWEIILFVVVITPIIVLWLGCVLDAITRPDLSGAMKVLWILAVLLFPIVGSLVYILVRPTVIVPADERPGRHVAGNAAWRNRQRPRRDPPDHQLHV